MLKLLRQWLEAGVLEDGEVLPSDQGVSQGSVISPVLANVMLHELDRLWEDRCRQLGHLSRYCDDVVIVCRTEHDAREALRRVGLILARLGLTLHPDKTRVVDVRDGRQGFDFLGFYHRKVESWRWRGRRYLHQWPGRRATQRLRARIKALTAVRSRLHEPVQAIVAQLNQVLRGWSAYFRVGNAGQTFRFLDEYVRERLSLFVQKKAGRSGRRWKVHTPAFFRALGVHHLSGTVAWASATPTAGR
jgi:group II intron reverse transcriptase/maturase